MTSPTCDPADHDLKFIGNRKVDERYRGTLTEVWRTAYKGLYRCGLCGFSVFRDPLLEDPQYDLLQ